MDSKTINKLIRSEVWPVLRKQGFSVFDSRSAFAYNPPFVNVLSFQSFNSYLAEGLGCTTYSFTPRLGVYVIGSPGEVRIKRDKSGRLRPQEYECDFRRELRKRSPVDGFARNDVFYIDPEGRTTAACFEELKHLCIEFVPTWFKAHNDLTGMLVRMSSAEEADSEPFESASGLPGSYNWNRLRSVLLLVKHEQLRTEQTAREALEAIDRTIGTVLDFSTIQSQRPNQEKYVFEMRHLWDQLGSFKPIQIAGEVSRANLRCLDAEVWASLSIEREVALERRDSPDAASVRKVLWPLLKEYGFSEFTNRLAHRISDDLVEVVEVLPMDPAERKAWNLPGGLFRIGVGVFWPTLEDGIERKNGAGKPRPVVNECHISNWLIPSAANRKEARTSFDSVEDATTTLTIAGFTWFDILRDCNSALALLRSRNWELFWRDPLMRGFGAESSSRRLVYIAYLERLSGNMAEAQSHMRRAEEVLHKYYPKHLHSRYTDWIGHIKTRLVELC